MKKEARVKKEKKEGRKEEGKGRKVV